MDQNAKVSAPKDADLMTKIEHFGWFSVLPSLKFFLKLISSTFDGWCWEMDPNAWVWAQKDPENKPKMADSCNAFTRD